MKCLRIIFADQLSINNPVLLNLNGEDLILSEFHMLKKAKLELPSGSINLDHMDYDQRIELFQHISKSLLFSYKPIDLIFFISRCLRNIVINHSILLALKVLSFVLRAVPFLQ